MSKDEASGTSSRLRTASYKIVVVTYTTTLEVRRALYVPTPSGLNAILMKIVWWGELYVRRGHEGTQFQTIERHGSVFSIELAAR